MIGLQVGLVSFAIFLIIVTLIPFVKSDYWTFRVFDFPRVQKLVLSLITFIAMVTMLSNDVLYQTVCILLAINIVYLLRQVLPFTPLGKKWVQSIEVVDEQKCISITVCNVFQDNRDYAKCMKIISNADPDVLLLLETDNAWKEGIQPLREQYPNRVEVPLENTYGMLLYSKFPLRNMEVKYLVESDIPSIHGQVQLKSGKWVQLYCLHPTPPVPNENPRSTERDKELLLVAALAEACQYPVLVAGDMNDVAWSYTTELFLKMSGLLDPRRGRGFYNSFSAKHRLMRFPLDHVFISPHFKLVSLRRLRTIGSDHFPIYSQFQYEASAEDEQEVMEPDAEDIQNAEETLNKETEI